MSNGIKVCHVGYEHRANDIRIFEKECRSLSNEGYKVTYITSDKHPESVPKDTFGVDIEIVSLNNMRRGIRMLQYNRIIKKKLLEIDADIYHLHEWNLLPLVNFLKKHGKKLIYDMHEDTPRQMGTFFQGEIGNAAGVIAEKCLDHYERKQAKNVDYIITATPHIEEVVKRNIRSKNVSTICNYPLMYETHTNEPKQKQACYAGGLSVDRNLKEMVMAIGKTDGIRLKLAGHLSEQDKAELQHLQGWNRTDYLGWLDKEHIHKLYVDSMIGLCVLKATPNIYCSLPIKLFEYMEAGIPVICSDFTLWKAIIEENNCGLCVDPENVDSIAEAICYLANNPDIAKQMGMNGRKIVEQKYNWKNEEQKLSIVYKNVENT